MTSLVIRLSICTSRTLLIYCVSYNNACAFPHTTLTVHFTPIVLGDYSNGKLLLLTFDTSVVKLLNFIGDSCTAHITVLLKILLILLLIGVLLCLNCLTRNQSKIVRCLSLSDTGHVACCLAAWLAARLSWSTLLLTD